MGKEWSPFEVVKKDEKTILRLHGGLLDQLVVVAGDKVILILDAIKRGWDIDLHKVAINGDLDIEETRDPATQRNFFIVPKNEAKSIKIRFSKILGRFKFAYTVFNGEVDFKGTTFVEIAEFDQSDFKDYARFTNATFAEGASFGEAVFNNVAQFSSAKFFGNAIFSDTTFGSEARFGFTIFRKYANFESAKFSVCASFSRADMRYPANFANVDFEENTVLKGLWSNIIRPIFWRWYWPLGYVFSTLWKRMQTESHKPTDFFHRGNRVCDLWKKVQEKLLVTDFSRLNTNTVMDGSSNPWLKRYIDDEQWINSWRYRGKPQRFLFYLWEAMCHCGRSIGLWAFWSAVIAFTFGAIYGAFGCNITFNVEHLRGQQPNFLGYLYYSVVTFTTLGFGDVVPLTNWARLAVGAEVVCGYVMLGGLISIFANKLARRS